MLGQLLAPEIEEMIGRRDFFKLRTLLSDWSAPELAALIDQLPEQADVIAFRLLPRELATETFEFLSSEKQRELVVTLAEEQERLSELLNDLAPDERTALLGEMPGEVSQGLLGLLSAEEYRVAVSLLGYPEESVGRLMTPDYVAVRSDSTVKEVLAHIRRRGSDSETLNVIYVVDSSMHLVDDFRIRELLLTDPEVRIDDLLDHRFVALKATDDQEEAIKVFRDYDRVALPVTDTQGVLLGIVTVDDVLDVVEQETTEDIQKLGGSEALEAPYLNIPFWELVGKRGRWLIVLFVGEMLTTSAMGYFEDEIQSAVVLALFVPLIISSGGNSGSQAASFIIRALAIGEVALRDWWKVFRREILSGLVLGAILGVIGVLRVALWEELFGSYGEYWLLIGLTVGISLVGVVLWGTLTGAMLPFVMQRLGADPAASSTPFVATLVDVTGVIIYFSVAAALLSGTLL